MGERLPLFPLSTPLLPGLLLPLHIFEDRYRRLITDLLRKGPGNSAQFGIVAIRRGSEVGAGRTEALHEVGCAAQLQQVEHLDDGCFDIVVRGAGRFRLIDVDDDAPEPYLVGRVAWLPDAPAAPPELTGRARRALTGYLQVLQQAGVEDAAARGDLDDDVPLSYAVAAAMVLDSADLQQLLEASGEETRLLAECRLLARETALLQVSASVPAARFSGGLASFN